MIKITGALLERLTGGHARDSFIDEIAEAMNEFFPQFDITTELRIEHFLAQAAHESDSFKTLYEYWGPTKAQKGYEGRKDLGNTQKGDGFRYRGRGIFQLTGRANYRDIGKALGLTLEKQPDLAADPRNAVHIACKFWDDRNLNDLADADNVTAITKRINGGTNGLADRKIKLAAAKKLIKRATAAPLVDPDLLPAGEPVGAGAPDYGPPETVVTPSSDVGVIAQLQAILTEKDYGKLNPNGEWGDLTSGAIMLCQKFNDYAIEPDVLSLEDARAAKQFVATARAGMTVAEIKDTKTEAATSIKKGTAVKVVGGVIGGVPVAKETGLLGWFGSQVERITGITDAIAPIIDPIKGAGGFLVANIWWVLPIGGAALWYFARQYQFSVADAFKRGD